MPLTGVRPSTIEASEIWKQRSGPEKLALETASLSVVRPRSSVNALGGRPEQPAQSTRTAGCQGSSQESDRRPAQHQARDDRGV